MSILNDGTNVLGSATPRAATPTDPPGSVDPLVAHVAGLTIHDIEEALTSGELTSDEVTFAEDPRNGGRGRAGVLALTGG